MNRRCAKRLKKRETAKERKARRLLMVANQLKRLEERRRNGEAITFEEEYIAHCYDCKSNPKDNTESKIKNQLKLMNDMHVLRAFFYRSFPEANGNGKFGDKVRYSKETEAEYLTKKFLGLPINKWLNMADKEDVDNFVPQNDIEFIFWPDTPKEVFVCVDVMREVYSYLEYNHATMMKFAKLGRTWVMFMYATWNGYVDISTTDVIFEMPLLVLKSLKRVRFSCKFEKAPIEHFMQNATLSNLRAMDLGSITQQDLMRLFRTCNNPRYVCPMVKVLQLPPCKLPEKKFGNKWDDFNIFLKHIFPGLREIVNPPHVFIRNEERFPDLVYNLIPTITSVVQATFGKYWYSYTRLQDMGSWKLENLRVFKYTMEYAFPVKDNVPVYELWPRMVNLEVLHYRIVAPRGYSRYSRNPEYHEKDVLKDLPNKLVELVVMRMECLQQRYRKLPYGCLDLKVLKMDYVPYSEIPEIFNRVPSIEKLRLNNFVDEPYQGDEGKLQFQTVVKDRCGAIGQHVNACMQNLHAIGPPDATKILYLRKRFDFKFKAETKNDSGYWRERTFKTFYRLHWHPAYGIQKCLIDSEIPE